MTRLSLLALALAAALPLAAQEGSRVYDLSEVEAPPAVQNAPALQAALAARYPVELAEAGVAGTVVVSFVIGADGAVRDPAVVDAPHEALGAATVEAVRVLRFAPAMVGGAPVDVRVTFPVQWQVAPQKAPGGERSEGAMHPNLRKLIDEDPSLAPLAQSTVRLGAVEQEPRARNSWSFSRALAREYPPALRAAGTGGTVVVRFAVGTDGVPAMAHVISFTDAAFIEPTLRAIRHLRFDPARLNGNPVRAWAELPIVWMAEAESEVIYPWVPHPDGR